MTMTPEDRRRWRWLRRRFARAALKGDVRGAHTYGLQLTDHAASHNGCPDYAHWARLVALVEAGEPIPDPWLRDLEMAAGRIH